MTELKKPIPVPTRVLYVGQLGAIAFFAISSSVNAFLRSNATYGALFLLQFVGILAAVFIFSLPSRLAERMHLRRVRAVHILTPAISLLFMYLHSSRFFDMSEDRVTLYNQGGTRLVAYVSLALFGFAFLASVITTLTYDPDKTLRDP